MCAFMLGAWVKPPIRTEKTRNGWKLGNGSHAPKSRVLGRSLPISALVSGHPDERVVAVPDFGDIDSSKSGIPGDRSCLVAVLAASRCGSLQGETHSTLAMSIAFCNCESQPLRIAETEKGSDTSGVTPLPSRKVPFHV